MLNCQKWVLEKWLPWQWLNWYGYNQHTIVFSDKFYDKSPNFVAVAVFVAKIQIFEFSAGLCAPPLCKIGLNMQLYRNYSQTDQMFIDNLHRTTRDYNLTIHRSKEFTNQDI